MSRRRSAASASASADGSSLQQLVPSGWRSALAPVLSSGVLEALDAFLASEAREARVFPPRAQIFQALEETPPEAVKVVILGQDPYPTAGNANGLAFSVAPGQKVPASLRNIFAGLRIDLDLAAPVGGDLTLWTRRGVLLLNTVLTVREGQPASHRKKGWESVTDSIIQCVDRQPGPVVFLCFGAHAKAMVERLVDPTRHPVLFAPHPSPLNGKAFVVAVERERFFSRANAILSEAGRGPIDWSLAEAEAPAREARGAPGLQSTVMTTFPKCAPLAR